MFSVCIRTKLWRYLRKVNYYTKSENSNQNFKYIFMVRENKEKEI